MEEFFNEVRPLFHNKLSQSQVDGINNLLEVTKGQPVKHRAYMLATAYWETAKTMQPIEEYGKGRGRPYGKPTGPYNKIYYGRGYVQLTWYDNYKEAEDKLHFDLVQRPELALKPDIAAKIMLLGMTEGWFTGHKLSDYSDYKSMRRIINGTDKAALIASYAEVFERALSKIVEEPTITITVSKSLWQKFLDWLTKGN